MRLNNVRPFLVAPSRRHGGVWEAGPFRFPSLTLTLQALRACHPNVGKSGTQCKTLLWANSQDSGDGKRRGSKPRRFAARRSALPSAQQ